MSAETIVLGILAWLCFAFPLAVLVGKFIARGDTRARAERAEIDGPLTQFASDPERRTRAFLAASNARARRANAFRTDKNAPATLHRPGA